MLAAATPVLVALWSVRNRTWLLTGDWASIDFRVRQVGSSQTPLVGAYSTRGWAHPGPVIYWLAAPVQWLVGGDARGLYLTAALVNIASMAGIATVVRRRQGPGMAGAVMVAMAVLVYGLRPNRVMDIWNPLLPLFPLLLVTFLAWSAATGHRRHGIVAIVLAALVGQAHVGLLPVLAVIGAWAMVWVLATARSAHHEEAVDRPEPTRRAPMGWGKVVGIGTAGAVVTWIPPIADQFWGTGNLGRVLDYFTGGTTQPIGFGRGLELVSRFVRPDGPWMGGAEPIRFLSMAGSTPIFVAIALAALVALTVLLWRTGDRATAAGTSLAGTLVLGAVPIASRLDQPVFDYLVRWIEVLGALTWFWIAWGTWRLVRPRVPETIRRPMPAIAVTAAAVVAALTIPGAGRFQLQGENEAPAVQAIRHDLEAVIAKDQLVRIEHRGDVLGNVTSGIIYWLIRDGYHVVTSDGHDGLKYGPDATWEPGDAPQTEVYTVAVDYPHRVRSSGAQCDRSPEIRPVARYHQLDRGAFARLAQFTAKRFYAPDSITAADRRSISRLVAHDFRVTVYVGPFICGDGPGGG